MEQYLEKLKKDLDKKNINNFWVLCDHETFKIIKDTKENIIKKLQNNPDKYGNQNIAFISLVTNNAGFKKNDWIFAIKINIYQINEKGKINQTPYDSWGLILKYLESDLEEKKFKIEYVEKLIDLVNEKIIVSALDGIYYNDFLKKIKKIKNQIVETP